MANYPWQRATGTTDGCAPSSVFKPSFSRSEGRKWALGKDRESQVALGSFVLHVVTKPMVGEISACHLGFQ